MFISCKKKLYKRKTSGGFTLVELMVVVTIVGVLVGIAVPNFLLARVKTTISKVRAEMQGIETAINMYWNDHHTYPISSADFTEGEYMGAIPGDPFNKNNVRRPKDGALKEGSYGYYVSSDVAWIIVSNGPDGVADVSSGEIDWNDRSAHLLGGWEGEKTGYGFTWYDPDEGLSSSGDLGLSGS